MDSCGVCLDDQQEMNCGFNGFEAVSFERICLPEFKELSKWQWRRLVYRENEADHTGPLKGVCEVPFSPLTSRLPEEQA